MGSIMMDSYVNKEYAIIEKWITSTEAFKDTPVNFNWNLPDTAAGLDTSCFDCILAGGDYNSSNKCIRGDAA
jgi:hypothetical protein